MERFSSKLLDILNEQDFCFTQEEMRTVEKAIGRFAAYEDTGLEPEEVLTGKELAEVACAVNLLKEYQDIGPVDRFRELSQAEKDGRVVVLPCNVGDTVWFIRPYENEIIKTFTEKMVVKGSRIYMKLSCNKMYETSCNSIGKTVFFTREEAEAALKRREEGNEAD